MNNRPDDPDATYLPERYRQQVRAKKQRRIYKKLVAAVIAISVFIVAGLLVSSMLTVPLPSGSLPVPVTPAPAEKTPAPAVNVTVSVTPGYETGTGIPALHSPNMLSPDTALSALREDYPADTYTLISLNLTDRYSGHTLYEFTLQPADRLPAGAQFTVFEDAVTGNSYIQGQDTARITGAQAQELAKKIFPSILPDKVKVKYSASPDTGRMWNFSLVKGTGPVLTGTLDAETGLVSSFTRTITRLGRPAEPVLDMPAAEKIAKRYIADQNGPVAVNLSQGRYNPMGSPSDPVAGQFIFIYNRIVNDVSCEEDGFILGVDSVNGDISAYERHWSAPDNAFSLASEPLVLKREATFAVLQQARETYPESVSGLRIVSAEIKWKDQHPYGVNPRPGGIPLAWKVMFDDDIIRTNNTAQPVIAWVDAQTGKILDFPYRH